MNCDRIWPAAQKLVDGEAGFLEAWWLRRHLRHCAGCATQFNELQELRNALRAGLPRYPVPAGLAARIGRAIAQEAPPPVAPRRLATGWSLATGGMAGALAGIAATLFVLDRGPAPTPQGLDGELIANHLRSMMGEHLVDVPTSDQHTVKPWLSSRLSVSPPVRDLSAEGFVLVGGRLDRVDRESSAVVVYRRRQHVINLFVWPTTGPDQPMRTVSRQGFNIINWARDGMELAAVSDLNTAELREFASLMAQS